jgi:hypothetical protein
VDVARARDGPGVPEDRGGRVDRLDDVLARLCCIARLAGCFERPEREHRAGPGAKVLGAHRRIVRGLAEVGIHGVGVDPLDGTVVLRVLEEVLAGQVLGPANDRGQAAIDDPDLLRPARLPTKAETHPGTADLGVAIPQGRQAERAIQARVFVVADAHPGELEQPDHRRQDLLARQSRRAQVTGHLSPDPRQPLPEPDQPIELPSVPARAKRRVVSVLQATTGIATDGLQMARRIGADPDVRPCRRDREPLDPGERGRVADQPSGRPPVPERATRTLAPNAGVAVVCVVKAGPSRVDPGRRFGHGFDDRQRAYRARTAARDRARQAPSERCVVVPNGATGRRAVATLHSPAVVGNQTASGHAQPKQVRRRTGRWDGGSHHGNHCLDRARRDCRLPRRDDRQG